MNTETSKEFADWVAWLDLADADNLIGLLVDLSGRKGEMDEKLRLEFIVTVGLRLVRRCVEGGA